MGNIYRILLACLLFGGGFILATFAYKTSSNTKQLTSGVTAEPIAQSEVNQIPTSPEVLSELNPPATPPTEQATTTVQAEPSQMVDVTNTNALTDAAVQSNVAAVNAQAQLQQEELARQQAQEELRKQEALARQQAEAEKRKQEELAKQKADAEKRKQEELAKQKADAEKRKKEELAKQKAEAEKRKQEELAKQKVDAEKSSSQWMVQVSLTTNQEDGKKLIARLKERGYKVVTSTTTKGTRIMVGPYKDKAAAEASRQKINNDGALKVKGAWVNPWTPAQ